MDFYPSEFLPAARDRIEKEKIRAYRELLPSSVYDSKEQDLAIRCVMRIFLAFSKEACALRKERGWTIDRIESESEEFLRRLAIMVVFEKFPGLDPRWFPWGGSIASDVQRRFRASAEWNEYEELLLATPFAATMNAARSNMREPPIKPTLEKQEANWGPTIGLTDREKKILEVIQRGSRGLAYCRELDDAGIGARRAGSWKGAPLTYTAAYQAGQPWRHRIQDEKSKISRKAKLAKTRK
jgi:hypothetical protein